MLNVQELRRDGYRVRVSHHRILEIPIRSPEGATDPVDDVVTQREYELAVNEGRVPFCNHHEMMWGSNVLPHGGFTEVEVTCPDGTELHGKFNFNNRQFNRKIGVQAALGRALKTGGK